MAMTEEQFLARVRAALADRGAPVDLPDDLEVARVISDGVDLVATFTDRATQAKMHVHRAPDDAAVVEKVLEIVRGLGARSALVPAEDWPGREAVTARLAAEGLTLHDPDDAESGFVADVGITGVAAAVAETGSIALVSGGPRRRLASLAVPHHIAVVRREQLVPDLLDWASRQPADMPAKQLLVTGPSKTADIELTLVMGVHGPKTEDIIIVG